MCSTSPVQRQPATSCQRHSFARDRSTQSVVARWDIGSHLKQQVFSFDKITHKPCPNMETEDLGGDHPPLESTDSSSCTSNGSTEAQGVSKKSEEGSRPPEQTMSTSRAVIPGVLLSLGVALCCIIQRKPKDTFSLSNIGHTHLSTVSDTVDCLILVRWEAMLILLPTPHVLSSAQVQACWLTARHRRRARGGKRGQDLRGRDSAPAWFKEVLLLNNCDQLNPSCQGQTMGFILHLTGLLHLPRASQLIQYSRGLRAKLIATSVD